MENKTLEIKKEAAITAYENATSKGKKMLVDLFGRKTFEKSPIERIKTVDDILEDHDLTTDDFNCQNRGLTDDEVAYRIIKMLCKSLNEGWEPDWNNSNEIKYYPWFKMDGSSGFRFDVCDGWLTGSFVGSRLCFKSRELAEYAGKQFEDVYKTLFTL